MPPSEKAQDDLFEKIQTYNRLLSQLKQYTEDNEGNPVSAYDDPENFYKGIGLSEDEEVMLTTVLAGELRERRAKKENIDISQVMLEMVHIHDVTINYDYLIELIAQMADEIHTGEVAKAEKTKEDISIELAKSDNIKEKERVTRFVNQVYNGTYVFERYPAPRDIDSMTRAMEQAQSASCLQQLTAFIRTWGLDNSVKPKELEDLIQKHRIGQEDLDKQGEVTKIMNDARSDYPVLAAEEIASLPWVKYRNALRKALYALADQLKKIEG